MYDFAFHRPSSIADAVKILSADPEARPVSELLPPGQHFAKRLLKDGGHGRPLLCHNALHLVEQLFIESNGSSHGTPC